MNDRTRTLKRSSGDKETTYPDPSAKSKPDAAFELAYSQMMENALAMSRGERKRRLLEKHGHAEKMLAARVLWPALGSLEGLHPEFEIQDLRSGNRSPITFISLRIGLGW
ncbi:hypothetical protein [Cohnella zeiphila]|uniref:Uncharacterized protein n=1 Tax=Cohnella zeiphila TaxID=2761120 RepID=A0A7X0VUQ8_9BACL|nr:hypothetical protein [Cohnella zeiphila]MBB6731196.1 hypothetical protein [Cohnella zeiphila]